MVWRIEDPQGNEAGKIKYEIVPYTRGAVLDLGCGPHKAYPHFIGIDSCKDTELFGIDIQPDLVLPDCAYLQDAIQDESVDAVFSAHLLEHIENYKGALASWWKTLKVGGYLVLYLPHKDLYPNIGEPGSNPDHKHDFSPEDITAAMREIGGWDLVRDEMRAEDCEYSFLQVYRKISEPIVHRYSADDALESVKQRACVVRYGGFGDMLQAANLLPALKREGYHVTVMTTPKGADILKHDPSVDEFFIQDDNQVPNHELWAFWQVQEQRFDKFINLCESVEGTLLAMPGRASHMWPHAVRAKYLDLNYLEFTSELAGLPYSSESRFYPSGKELQAVGDMLQQAVQSKLLLPAGVVAPVQPGYHILFALAGSSIHKFWPHQDEFITAVLQEFPQAHVWMVGDDACRILESGWEDTDRVHCLSGELSIRETLTLATQVDCVIGPETGVLNAVAFEPMLKICLLSHSSVHNLTKHWTNAVSLSGDVPCYPCHRLHQTSEYCQREASTGAAICQVAIPFDAAVAAVRGDYENR